MASRQPVILVIEDDLELRELYEQRLRLEKLDVRLAPDGRNGFELAAIERPDAILLDLRLPKLDGFDFLKAAKKDPRVRDIPIIVLSALWQEEDKRRAMELGAEIFLVKSETTPKQVVETIKTVIDEKNKTKKFT